MCQRILRTFTSLLLFTLLVRLVEGSYGYGHGRRIIRVKAPQSIQHAIDQARPGDHIYVGPGKYSEYLTIAKDGIELVGHNAILESPNTPPKKPNGCVGLADAEGKTTAGICIIGSNVKQDTFVKEHRKVSSVGRYVKNVRVEGFHVRGFSGLNIAIVGAHNTKIKGNTVSNGPLYGMLTVGSTSTLIKGNRVKANLPALPFIGVCMDDTSDVQVTQNTISDYGIGLCIQTKNARVTENKVSNCCFGAFIDPGIDGAKVLNNKIGASNKRCNPDFGGFATGIAIAGTNSKVEGNVVSGTTDGGHPTNIAAGLSIFDQGPVATGNLVTKNVLKNNDQDILLFTTGKNKVVKNKCSTPEEICKAQ